MKISVLKSRKLLSIYYSTIFLPLVFIVLLTLPFKTFSQDTVVTTLEELKQLSIEELMNIEVTSVAKVPQKISEVPSAIQVITRQDIQRSAATSVPEALRLSPNLQVTQLNTRHWIISARGFNSTFSNKLLVMIDGRTVYSPLFAGVFWDAQNLMLEDIDRIEVISGPGGTLWGANAVNGVINIITRGARNTQGLFVSGAVGSMLEHQVEARYGGKIGSNLSYRIYGHQSKRDHTFLSGEVDNTDRWKLTQGGFAMDWDPSEDNSFSFQGNFYRGKDQTGENPSNIDGQNIMGKWTRTFSERSGLIVQAYVDRTWRRDIPNAIDDELYTYDIDLQHSFLLSKNHHIVWGGGYRLMDDQVFNRTQFVGFLPEHRMMHLLSSFIQDEISIVPDRFKLTLGTKLQHNEFSGFELQPSARVSYTPMKHQVLWSAISRAVRSPSRIDVDYHIPAYVVAPNIPSVAGGPNFTSEKVIAYELGYRVQPSTQLSISVAGFYNRYDDLYSVEVLPGTQTLQIQNGVEGNSHGFELSGNWVLNSKWRLRGGYTYFDKDLKNKPGNTTDEIVLTNLGSDSEHQVVLHSILDLHKNFHFDVTGRFVDSHPVTQYNPEVEAYFTADAKVGWRFTKQLDLSVAAQNLFDKRHAEVGAIQIPRSFYGKISWRY